MCLVLLYFVLMRSARKRIVVSKTNRNRVVWTEELKERFVDAVELLGCEAVPTAILREMNVDGLTRQNVASHLQKYREQQQQSKPKKKKKPVQTSEFYVKTVPSPREDITKTTIHFDTPPTKKRKTSTQPLDQAYSVKSLDEYISSHQSNIDYKSCQLSSTVCGAKCSSVSIWVPVMWSEQYFRNYPQVSILDPLNNVNNKNCNKV